MAVKKGIKNKGKVVGKVSNGNVAKKSFGRTADPKLAAERAKGTPTMVFLPKALRARVSLICQALDTNKSTVIREQLERWVKENKKALARIVDVDDSMEYDEEVEEDVEENEDEETEEDDEEGEEEEDEDEG